MIRTEAPPLKSHGRQLYRTVYAFTSLSDLITEGEELEDEAALEDEELRSDARGVEEHDGDMDED